MEWSGAGGMESKMFRFKFIKNCFANNFTLVNIIFSHDLISIFRITTSLLAVDFLVMACRRTACSMVGWILWVFSVAVIILLLYILL